MALLLLACACRRETVFARPDAPGAVDTAGAAPRRVVALAPSLTEIAFASGAGPLIVGVDDFVEFPVEATSLPRVGGLLNPNFEKILSLRPDLVIMVKTFRTAADRLQRAGVRTAIIPAESLSDLDAAVASVGDATHRTDGAARLRRRIRDELAAVEASVRGRPRPRTAFVLDRRPGSLTDIYVAGRASFLAELVEMAGGQNVFDDVKPGAARVGVEELLRRAPQVILDSTKDPDAEAVWAQLGPLPGGERRRVISVWEHRIAVPGPRVGLAARRLAGWLHPSDGAPDGG